MISIFSKVKEVALAAAMVAAMGAQAAPVGQPVTINENAIPGVSFPSQAAVAVDQLSGQYDEVLSVAPSSATSGTFTTEAIFAAGGWFKNGASVSTLVNAPDFLGGYRLYAKFVGSGSYNLVGGQFVFSGGSGAIELWADPDQNTVYNVATTSIGVMGHLINTSGAASLLDDKKLGTASMISFGQGQVTPGGANGNFELVYNDFALAVPTGDAYFIAPRPFYMLLDLNGNFQSFNPTTLTDIQLLNNSANAFFMKVPEPGALALVGIALLGLGLSGRRARKA